MKEWYFLGCVLVGMISAYDGFVLYQCQGRPARNKIVLLTSSMEFLWLLVTLYALFSIEFLASEYLIPVLYILHNVFGFVYSLLCYPGMFKSGPEELSQIQIPRWYTLFGMSFGLVFMLASIVVSLQA